MRSGKRIQSLNVGADDPVGPMGKAAVTVRADRVVRPYKRRGEDHMAAIPLGNEIVRFHARFSLYLNPLIGIMINYLYVDTKEVTYEREGHFQQESCIFL